MPIRKNDLTLGGDRRLHPRFHGGRLYDQTNRRIGATSTDNSWWSYPATATAIAYTANSLDQYTAVAAVTPT
jgi:hypothetical protein